MKQWKNRLCALSVAVICALSPVCTEAASLIPSDWAAAEFDHSVRAGLVPWELYEADYTRAITRQEFCILIVNAYLAQTGGELDEDIQPVFTDAYRDEVTAAYHLGLVSGDPDGSFRPYDSISRQEAAVMLCKLQEMVGRGSAPAGMHFTDSDTIADWAWWSVAAVAETGLMMGMADGSFAPAENVSVQQGILLAGRLVTADTTERPVITAPAALAVLPSDQPITLTFDRAPENRYQIMAIRNDGSSYGSRAVQLGTADKDSYTIAPGTLDANCAYTFVVGENDVWSAPAKVFTDAPQLLAQVTVEGWMATVAWDMLPGISTYHVHVVEARTTRHAEEIGPNNPVYYDIDGADRVQFAVNPDKLYTITLWADGGYTHTVEIYTPPAVDMMDKYDAITGYGEITSREQAEALMETVKVNVWKLSGGRKVASTAYVTVHKAIAGKVQAVFEDIFQGEEKFPIQSVGGYAWRENDPNVSRSEHNLGTAIDLNPSQNYCIYGSGAIVGDYWKPYEDPYSITPYGDVMRAFERHGFVWGGDAWNSTRDYMHFSYLGT